MTATAHALVSGAIAASVSNPMIVYPLAFISHFIMDAVPHWDIGTNWRKRSKFATGSIAILDTIIGFSLAYFLFAGKADPNMLLLSMMFGNLPDWMEAPYYIFFAKAHQKEPHGTLSFWEHVTYTIYKLENSLHSKAQFPFGVFTQIATVAFFLILLSHASSLQ